MGKKGKNILSGRDGFPCPGYHRSLIKAVLIAEDDKFWSHEGFDYEAMQKAIEKDIKAKKFKLGGSTISQQLARISISLHQKPCQENKRGNYHMEDGESPVKRESLNFILM